LMGAIAMPSPSPTPKATPKEFKDEVEMGVVSNRTRSNS
jgi:hypothetical protein